MSPETVLQQDLQTIDAWLKESPTLNAVLGNPLMDEIISIHKSVFSDLESKLILSTSKQENQTLEEKPKNSRLKSLKL
ncbi:hypothetical protein VCHA53O466_50381 [Vibrio chagasii]|nr:hypothetical protein VCHA53O466_50381 [Vibrio chagasii]